jgi:hypothetical protein
MLVSVLLALQALAALGAVAFWAAAMYLWFLRNHSSRPGAAVTGNQVFLRFAGALIFTVAAWAFRMLGQLVSGP